MEELRNLFKTSDRNNSVDCPVEFRYFYDAAVSTLECSKDYFKDDASLYCSSCKYDKDKSLFDLDKTTKKSKASCKNQVKIRNPTCKVLSVECTLFDRGWQECKFKRRKAYRKKKEEAAAQLA